MTNGKLGERENDYGVSSRSYLSRARDCLLNGGLRYLFYAAFELRCCVEARQDEYLEAQKRYRRSSPRSWEINKKSKELERIFAQDKIVRVTLSGGCLGSITLYHVPVNINLRKQAQKIGEYMHAMLKSRPVDDEWWQDFNRQILEIYRSAWLTCQGHLLCPLFLHSDGTTEVAFEFDRERFDTISLEQLVGEGRLVDVQVEYLSNHPEDWKCDL